MPVMKSKFVINS